MEKLEYVNLEPKIWVFWAAMLKNHCHICILEFVLLQSLVQEITILKFGTKSARFSYFGAGTWKYYYHIWSQHPRICLDVNFGAKIKILKFGTKDNWFGNFWAVIWKWYYVWNQHPRIGLIAKFHEIMKLPKFGIKNASYGYGLVFYKNYSHI